MADVRIGALLVTVLATTCLSARADQYVVDDQRHFLIFGLYDGTLESMFAASVDVKDDEVIRDIDVHVDIAYTWTGDLVIKLESPSGAIVDLMSRPGFDEPADDGSGCCGESSDLIFGNLYEFDDDAPLSSELIGAMGEDPIASCSHYSSGFQNEFGLTRLEGEDSVGTWTLYVADAGTGGDDGIYDGFTLQINCDCHAELDEDCTVGLSDLLVVLSGWGACSHPEEPCPADVDQDGLVGIGDVVEVLSSWGPC